MRCALFALLALLLAPLAIGPGAGPALAAVDEKGWSAAINVAGRQRMLSQKMFKEMLLVHHQVDVEANAKAMAGTIKLFTDSHRRLVDGDAEQGIPAAPTPEVAAALSAIEAPWAAFREGLSAGGAVDAARLGALAGANERLLAAVAAMVETYEQAQKAAMGTATGKVINWAGRQRMLSQRMAKEALLIAAQADAEAARTRLAKARELFASSHAALSTGSAEAGIPAPADPQVVRQQAKVGDLWTGYQQVLDRVAAGDAAARADLAEASVRLLTETNRATSLLEAVAQ
jgi:nitrate/nitrite-specific signal transduction histidine kinase